MGQGEILYGANNAANKGLSSKIYEQLIYLNIKNNPIKIYTISLINIPTKESVIELLFFEHFFIAIKGSTFILLNNPTILFFC